MHLGSSRAELIDVVAKPAIDRLHNRPNPVLEEAGDVAVISQPELLHLAERHIERTAKETSMSLFRQPLTEDLLVDGLNRLSYHLPSRLTRK